MARVVSTILEDPSGHRGKVYELTGPRSEDMNEMAKEYATVLLVLRKMAESIFMRH